LAIGITPLGPLGSIIYYAFILIPTAYHLLYIYAAIMLINEYPNIARFSSRLAQKSAIARNPGLVLLEKIGGLRVVLKTRLEQ
jgi:hypothetical protein